MWFLLAANAHSARATANGGGACKDIVVLSIANPSLLPGTALRQTVSRLVPDSQNGPMTGNWRNVPGLCVPAAVSDCTNQDSKCVFLIVSDGQACVFPHVLTCVRTLRRLCSCIHVSDCARRQSAIQQLHLSPASLSVTASVVARHALLQPRYRVPRSLQSTAVWFRRLHSS